jgi:pilus assembly protein Flp/PilA
MLDHQAWRASEPAREGMQLIASFVENDSGSTAIEYGLIAAGIAIGINMAVTSLGSQAAQSNTEALSGE